LQVIYELSEDRPLDVYIGQQVDVYMKAATISKSIDSDTSLGSSKLPFEEDTPARQPGKPEA